MGVKFDSSADTRSQLEKIPLATDNLFNSADVIGGYYSGSVLQVNDGYISPNWIKIKGSTKYVTNLNPCMAVSFLSANKVYISGLTAGEWSGNFITPANAVYVSFAISKSFNISTLMFCEDTLPVSYQPYGYTNAERLNNTFVALSDVYIGGVGKNLFNYNDAITGKEVYNDATFATEINSAVTNYIPVIGLSNIYISGLTAYATGYPRYYSFYDKNKISLGAVPTFSKSSTEIGFAVPKDAVYFAMSIYQRKTSAENVLLTTIQIESGTSKSSYEAYKLGVASIKGNRFNYNPSPLLKTYNKNLLVFGDSISETSDISEDGATYTEGTRANWPTYSKTSLQFDQMWNYARSGATYKTQSVVGDIRKSLAEQINLAITNNRPGDVVVVSCGTNDGSSNLGDYATAMGKTSLSGLDRTLLYEAIRWAFWTIRSNYPSAICFVSTPIQKYSSEQPDALITAIKSMANRYNFIVIDALNESGIVREFENNGTAGRYLYDGLHPSTDGQLAMSNLFNRVITNSLNF